MTFISWLLFAYFTFVSVFYGSADSISKRSEYFRINKVSDMHLISNTTQMHNTFNTNPSGRAGAHLTRYLVEINSQSNRILQIHFLVILTEYAYRDKVARRALVISYSLSNFTWPPKLLHNVSLWSRLGFPSEDISVQYSRKCF